MHLFKRRKPLKKFEDFHSKALDYEWKHNYGQAIETRLQGLQLDSITNLQKADLLYGIGAIYLTQKDYQKASDYFIQAFQVVENEKIPYDKRYTETLDTLLQAGRKQDAKYLLGRLLKRQSYNRHFKKLEKYKEMLE